MPPKTKVWSDYIAEMSDAYKNARIELIDPSRVTSTYDVTTGTFVSTGDPVVATDVAARIQPFRIGIDIGANGTGNPSGELRLRIQIPRGSVFGRIQRGWQIRVLEAERSPDLKSYLFFIDAVVNSSWRASITIEATTNLENILGA